MIVVLRSYAMKLSFNFRNKGLNQDIKHECDHSVVSPSDHQGAPKQLKSFYFLAGLHVNNVTEESFD